MPTYHAISCNRLKRLFFPYNLFFPYLFFLLHVSEPNLQWYRAYHQSHFKAIRASHAGHLPYHKRLWSAIVIVNSKFLQRLQKRSHGNQLIHRHLSKTNSIGSGQDLESQPGMQAVRRLWWMGFGVETGEGDREKRMNQDRTVSKLYWLWANWRPYSWQKGHVRVLAIPDQGSRPPPIQWPPHQPSVGLYAHQLLIIIYMYEAPHITVWAPHGWNAACGSATLPVFFHAPRKMIIAKIIISFFHHNNNYKDLLD